VVLDGMLEKSKEYAFLEIPECWDCFAFEAYKSGSPKQPTFAVNTLTLAIHPAKPSST
jgi:hypothetical protein